MKLCPKCQSKYPDDANFCPQETCATAEGPQRLVADAPPSRFQLGPRIGGSGSGEVFQAVDSQTGETVAYKLVAAAALPTPAQVDRAQRELKQLARAQSERIARVVDHGRAPDGRLYIAQELCTGEPLDQLIQRNGPLSLERAKRIVSQLGEALLEGQKVGVVHHDVAAKNVLVGPSDGVKVLNFVVARPVGDRVFGVPEFLSPEQAEGKPVDQRSNTYSVGAILYLALTGEPPFQANDARTVLDMHLRAAPQPPSQTRPDGMLSAEVDRVVLKALEKSSSRRHLTLRQFLTEVEGLGASAPAGAAEGGSKESVGLAKTMMFAGGSSEVAQMVAQARAGGGNAPHVAVGGAPVAHADPAAAQVTPPPVLSTAPAAASIPRAMPVSAVASAPAAAPAVAVASAPVLAHAPAAAMASPVGMAASAGVAPTLMAAAAEPTPVPPVAPAARPAASQAPAAAAAAASPQLRAGGGTMVSPQASPAAQAQPNRLSYPPEFQPGAEVPNVADNPPKPAAKPAASGPPAASSAASKPAAKGAAFRETLWFKKGDVEQMVAEAKAKAAAAAAAKGGKPVDDVELPADDVRPVEDRYADDGSITAEDRKNFSLRQGGTATAMPAAGIVPGERMSETEMLKEIHGGKKTLIVVGVVAVVVALALVVVFTMFGKKEEGPGGAGKKAAAVTPTKAAGEGLGRPSAPPRAKTPPPAAAASPATAASKDQPASTKADSKSDSAKPEPAKVSNAKKRASHKRASKSAKKKRR